MNIALTGASGLTGQQLIPSLVQAGHQVFPFTRVENNDPTTIYWNIAERKIEAHKLEKMDALINLAGHNISSGRGSRQVKQAIYDSRIQGTKLLAETLNTLDSPPKVLINASAMGYYGSQGDSLLDESSPNGTGFLAKLCHDWEEEALKAQTADTRVVLYRIGLILSAQGGALKKMLTPFKLGLGGVLGNPHAYISWIDMNDLIQGLHFCLSNKNIQGPINAMAPNPVTNHEFTKTLGKVLHRPTPFPLPPPMVKLLFGEMGQELLLSSIRAIPAHLTAGGFQFTCPTLEESLNAQIHP